MLFPSGFLQKSKETRGRSLVVLKKLTLFLSSHCQMGQIKCVHIALLGPSRSRSGSVLCLPTIRWPLKRLGSVSFFSFFFFMGVNDFSVTWPKFRRYILALSLPLQLHFKVELVGIITVTKTDGYLGIKSSHRFPTDMEPWDIPTVEEPSDVHRSTNAPEHCDQQKCTVENLIQERLLKPVNR